MVEKLDFRETAIKAFYEIRNLPYHISVDGEKGMNCVKKSRLLAKKLDKLGYETREIVGLFKWSSCGLPKKLMAECIIDEGSHLWIETKAPGSQDWVAIDPTWNPELKNAGFTISEWDGLKPTTIGVKPYKILSPSETVEFLKVEMNPDTWEDAKKFYIIFNKFCDSFLRKEKI